MLCKALLGEETFLGAALQQVSASFGVVSFNLSLSGPGFVGHFGKEKVYMAARRKHATRTVTPCDFPVFPVVLF